MEKHLHKEKTAADNKLEETIKNHYGLTGFVLIGFGVKGGKDDGLMITTRMTVGEKKGEVRPAHIFAGMHAIRDHFFSILAGEAFKSLLGDLKQKDAGK